MKLPPRLRDPKSIALATVVIMSIFLGQDFLNWAINVINLGSGLVLEAR